MIEVVIAAVILGITLSFMVGPVFLLLLEIAMNKGAKSALSFDAGVIVADVLFIIAILFSSSFLNEVTNLSWVYSIGGAVIIAYGFYNVYNARKKKHHLEEKDRLPDNKKTPPGIYFVKGFFMNFLNVGVLAYWLATVVVMRASVDNDTELMTVYFIVTVATYAAVDVGKIFSARRLQSRLNDRVLVKIERVVGFVLIIFGTLMIFRGVLQSMGYSLESLLARIIG